MIPAGRRAVDRKALAVQVFGTTEPELVKSGALSVPGAPGPISSPAATGGRKLYDLAQWREHAAGRPVEALPAEPDPLDLLDRGDVAALLGIEPATWDGYVKDERAPAADRTRYGVLHWYRSTIEAYQAGRVGRGHGGGRPVGARDRATAGRRDRVAEVYALLMRDPGQVTPETVRHRYKISTAAAVKLIENAKARRDADLSAPAEPRRRSSRVAEVRTLLKTDPGQVTPEAVAARFGMARTTAAKVIEAARSPRFPRIAELLAGPPPADPAEVVREIARTRHMSYEKAAALVAEAAGQ
jgi:predicted DNA-binding transcriptional regulator AlpA